MIFCQIDVIDEGGGFMGAIIEIENFNKTIKKAVILENINLTFNSGKVYGLKGKNGSGKTMLMRAICGLILPITGCVRINGQILGKDISFPPSIGALLENPAFLNGYTGFKNLKMIASIQNRIDDKQIKDTLKQVGLDPEDRRTYKKYSLGMKQRLGIAAAIMEKPDIVILDEPINALDEAGARQVRGILKEQKERGAVCIIACHDTEELEFLSDEIIEIYEGRILDNLECESK